LCCGSGGIKAKIATARPPPQISAWAQKRAHPTRLALSERRQIGGGVIESLLERFAHDMPDVFAGMVEQLV